MPAAFPGASPSRHFFLSALSLDTRTKQGVRNLRSSPLSCFFPPHPPRPCLNLQLPVTVPGPYFFFFFCFFFFFFCFFFFFFFFLFFYLFYPTISSANCHTFWPARVFCFPEFLLLCSVFTTFLGLFCAYYPCPPSYLERRFGSFLFPLTLLCLGFTPWMCSSKQL